MQHGADSVDKYEHPPHMSCRPSEEQPRRADTQTRRGLTCACGSMASVRHTHDNRANMRLNVPTDCVYAREAGSCETPYYNEGTMLSNPQHMVKIEPADHHPPRHTSRGGASGRMIGVFITMSCCVCLGTIFTIVGVLPYIDGRDAGTARSRMFTPRRPSSDVELWEAYESIVRRGVSDSEHLLHRMALLHAELQHTDSADGADGADGADHASAVTIRDLFPNWVESDVDAVQRKLQSSRLNVNEVLRDLILSISAIADQIEVSSLNNRNVTTHTRNRGKVVRLHKVKEERV